MSEDCILEMKGASKTLQVFEDKVTLTPMAGLMGFLMEGFKGTKTIPFSSITSIQLKEAGMLMSGYLQFSIQGGNESVKGIFDAINDENSIVFKNDYQNENAQKIKAYIEEKILSSRKPQAVNSQSNIADELEKLANLKNMGILTQEEFDTAKKKILTQ